METITKICRVCGKNKATSEFAEWARGRKRKICKLCYSQEKAIKHKIDRKNLQKNQNINATRRAWRQNPKYRPTVIFQDTRNGDKKKLGQTNDLTKEFIANLIKDGCHYCGETKLQITLDRIDNSLPHNQNNVLSACVRCNLIRRELPFRCWVHIVPSIRSAKELGLFDDWVNKFTRK
jgi:hypothetical protein